VGWRARWQAMMGGKTQAHIRKRSKKQKKINSTARSRHETRVPDWVAGSSADRSKSRPTRRKKVLCKQIHTNFLMNHHTKIEKRTTGLIRQQV
jgi:hypothetical protein